MLAKSSDQFRKKKASLVPGELKALIVLCGGN